MIKGVLVLESQYTDANWSNYYRDALANCDGTDLIFMPMSTNVTPLIKAINDMDGKTSKNIWIGTMQIHSTNYSSASTSVTQIETFITAVLDALTTNIKKQVVGIYMNQEALYSGTINYTNFTSNAEIQKFLGVRTIVKNLGYQFLWIPYYGYGSNPAEVIKRLAYTADYVQIFDTVIIQPHYLFALYETGIKANLTAVKESSMANRVKYRDLVNACPSKNSNTEIGFEMEVDTQPTDDEANAITEYIATFSPIKNSSPSAFYWEGKEINALVNYVNNFY